VAYTTVHFNASYSDDIFTPVTSTGLLCGERYPMANDGDDLTVADIAYLSEFDMKYLIACFTTGKLINIRYRNYKEPG
jgi:hypothetical protein